MEFSLQEKRKKRSWKFWTVFWSVSFILLLCWALFLKYQKDGAYGVLGWLRPTISAVPVSSQRKNEIRTVFDIADYLSSSQEEKTFLILFQNDMELRPGGGYIGSFGILKLKDGKVTFVDTHDTNIFDDRTQTNVPLPYPMAKMLGIKDWELRDSNWSPDFPTNAQKAEEFYHLEGGGEQFDGVVAVSTNVLTTFLEITGPVSIEGYPGEYNSENAVLKLEYQVERGYKEQDIEKGKRKYVMKDLSRALISKAQNMSLAKKRDLLLAIEKNLQEKDIMLYFHDEFLQNKIEQIGWSGEVLDNDSDFLMLVDANLGSLKSDMYIKRQMHYTIDFSGAKPKANLKITYNHTADAKDWLTKDYNGYLRIYVPEGSWLTAAKNTGEGSFGGEFGKKYFGFIYKIPIGTEKTLELDYDLPYSVTWEGYDLLVQKQAGVSEIPTKITVINEDGIAKDYDFDLRSEWKLSEGK